MNRASGIWDIIKKIDVMFMLDRKEKIGSFKISI